MTFTTRQLCKVLLLLNIIILPYYAAIQKEPGKKLKGGVASEPTSSDNLTKKQARQESSDEEAALRLIMSVYNEADSLETEERILIKAQVARILVADQPSISLQAAEQASALIDELRKKIPSSLLSPQEKKRQVGVLSSTEDQLLVIYQKLNKEKAREKLKNILLPMDEGNQHTDVNMKNGQLREQADRLALLAKVLLQARDKQGLEILLQSYTSTGKLSNHFASAALEIKSDTELFTTFEQALVSTLYGKITADYLDYGALFTFFFAFEKLQVASKQALLKYLLRSLQALDDNVAKAIEKHDPIPLNSDELGYIWLTFSKTYRAQYISYLPDVLTDIDASLARLSRAVNDEWLNRENRDDEKKGFISTYDRITGMPMGSVRDERLFSLALDVIYGAKKEDEMSRPEMLNKIVQALDSSEVRGIVSSYLFAFEAAESLRSKKTTEAIEKAKKINSVEWRTLAISAIAASMDKNSKSNQEASLIPTFSSELFKSCIIDLEKANASLPKVYAAFKIASLVCRKDKLLCKDALSLVIQSASEANFKKKSANTNFDKVLFMQIGGERLHFGWDRITADEILGALDFSLISRSDFPYLIEGSGKIADGYFRSLFRLKMSEGKLVKSKT